MEENAGSLTLFRVEPIAISKSSCIHVALTRLLMAPIMIVFLPK